MCSKDFKSLLEELKFRGLIQQSTNEEELDTLLKENKVRVYIGFDPTAPSLHHGNLVQLILLKHFQNWGHTPYCVVGGATGLIGDPRQSGERKLNDEKTVQEWVENLKSNISRFLDFDSSKNNKAHIANNYDWIKNIDAIEFLRDIGKHFRVSNMLAKETVSARLNSEEGISYTEFSYQVLQALDFLRLFEKENVQIQCGGNDQWGNLTAGTDLIRKVTGKTAHALTTPIITKADGTKFGKSEGGAVWLDKNMMSPYSFYQFWLNTDDKDAIKLLKVFTFLGKDEISSLEKSLNENPGLRETQKTLAKEATILVHGIESFEQAQNASNVLFQGGDISTLTLDTLNSLSQEIGIVEVDKKTSIKDAYIKAGLVKSGNEFKTAIKQNSISINNVKIQDDETSVENYELLHNKYLLLKKGKKQYTMLGI